MAATTQLALPTPTSPIALWHLLSLDAPTVAALWTGFVARTSHIRLPLAAPIAMALAVWILYAADRILDAAHPSFGGELEARHHFHHRHRIAFLCGIALAAVVLAVLLPHLDATAILLYLMEGALLVAWFVIVHATRAPRRLPKEIAVGLFFSAAVFIPTVAREPSLRLALLPSAILFAALCCLNCLFIYAWEHHPHTLVRPPHPTTQLALAHLPTLAVSIAIAAAITMLYPTRPNPIAAACALSAALLLVLDRNRHRLTRTHLRAAADLALLTPILLFPFLR